MLPRLIDITPTPPAWKNEKIQTLDRLIEQYQDIPQMPSAEYFELHNISQTERKQISTKIYTSQDRILQTMFNTLITIEDEKALNEWIQQYLILLKGENELFMPDVFHFAVMDDTPFPKEFVKKLDSQTVQNLKEYFKRGNYGNYTIERIFPGFTMG